MLRRRYTHASAPLRGGVHACPPSQLQCAANSAGSSVRAQWGALQCAGEARAPRSRPTPPLRAKGASLVQAECARARPSQLCVPTACGSAVRDSRAEPTRVRPTRRGARCIPPPSTISGERSAGGTRQCPPHSVLPQWCALHAPRGHAHVAAAPVTACRARFAPCRRHAHVSAPSAPPGPPRARHGVLGSVG